jgi:hemolysin D
LEVVGTASNGKEAIAQVGRLQPNIVLMDIEMPGLDGIAATRSILQQFSGVRVIVLSMHDEDYYVAQAVRAGAMGYVVKNTAHQELEEVIRSVHSGYVQIGSGLPSKVSTVSAEAAEVVAARSARNGAVDGVSINHKIQPSRTKL